MIIPTSFYFIFFSLVAIVFLVFCLFIKYGEKQNPKSSFTKKTGLLLLGWLIATHFLAQAQFFTKWDAMPPRLILAIAIPILGIIYLYNNRSFLSILKNIPLHWLIYFQSFRLVLELFLHGLYGAQIIPIQMTFEGLNFDILMGASALLMGFLVQKNKIGKPWVLAWNAAGIIFVTTIVVISSLSTPSPIRLFFNEPSNTFIGSSPFVWLPGFLVPMAYLIHFLSIKKLRN